MNKSPCYDCKNRYVGCHGNCQVYLEFFNSRAEYRDRVFQEKEANRAVVGAMSTATRQKHFLGW